MNISAAGFLELLKASLVENTEASVTTAWLLLLVMHFGCFWHRQGCQGALGKQMEKLYDVQLFTASTSSLADAGCLLTCCQNQFYF